MDVKPVFLHESLKEEVLMELPGEYKNVGSPSHVFRLLKALCALKQGHSNDLRKWTNFYAVLGLNVVHVTLDFT